MHREAEEPAARFCMRPRRRGPRAAVQFKGAAGLWRVGEGFQRRAQRLGFLQYHLVGDPHQLRQSLPGLGTDGHIASPVDDP